MANKKINFEVEEKKKNYSCTIYADIWGEIKRVEDESFAIDGKEYRRLRLMLDGKNDERFYLIDKNIEHQQVFERGLQGIFKVRIDVDEGYGGKTKIYIVGFSED